jgi:homoserine O-acetyltransferase
MAIALSALSRTAIRQDPAFHGGEYYDQAEKPDFGLRLARMIAMVTYKSPELFAERFGRRFDRSGGDPQLDTQARFDVEGYLAYQGQKFVERMDANSLLTLMRAMDLYHVQDLPTPQSHTTQLTFVGISSDWRCDARHICQAAERFRQRGYTSTYHELSSTHGHDAFLADLDDLTELTSASFAPIYTHLVT